MVKKKRQSKRQTLKDKYKIEKKVKEHHRKQRREQRKRLKDGIPIHKKKPLALPNLMPYKEKFLRQLMEDKEREKEHEKSRIQRLNEMKKQQEDDVDMMEEDDDDVSMASKNKRSGPSADDLANVEQRAREYEEKQRLQLEKEEDEKGALGLNPKGKKRMYLKELRNVVDSADVVLVVLDARDPMGCRAPQAEKMVLENAKQQKRLVFILNKVDLIPKHIADKWLTVLRKEFPTIAFRASTQEQRNNLSRAKNDSISLATSTTASGGTVGDSVCVGADTLLQLLKNYSRNKNIKTSITVGVVGYPNVGKSSIINSLKRSRAVGVSPTAGYTKNLQIVQLDKKVRLIDSPGVLFQDSQQMSQLVLRNALNPTDVDDPIAPIMEMLKICNHEQLLFLYKIPRFQTPIEFLVSVAKKRGKITKGGVPDQKGAARIVLQDWNAGRIPYYVSPPEEDTRKPRVTSTIVTEWAKEFDLEALMSKEQDELVEKLPSTDPNEFAVVFESQMNV